MLDVGREPPPTRYVSGHQPILFGTAGYFSKAMLPDLHIVTASVPFRKGDHLGRLELPSAGAVSVPLSAAKLIEDVRIGDTIKVRRAIKETFGAKRNPYRSRIEPVLEALTINEEEPYTLIWERVFRATCKAAGIRPRIWIDAAPPVGATTHERLMNRIKRISSCDVYVIGPGGLDYLRDDRRGIKFVVHRMKKPSPLPFLTSIVRDKDPVVALHDFTLEEVPLRQEKTKNDHSVSTVD